MTPNPLDLAIAIPAHNDGPLLMRLLHHVAALGLAHEIVVVDDGSAVAMDGEELRAISGLPASKFHFVRHEKALGPGAARNRALEHVTCSHVLYVDADDLPTRELRDLCQMLALEEAFDFCIFQYHDSRMERDRVWGMMDYDQVFWDQAGIGQSALVETSPTAAYQLVQTANYPWNKIYRTDFLRSRSIRCADIPVHQDIPLHWHGFLQADRILSSDHIGIVHFVQSSGGRLTNYNGEARLRVFETLSEIARAIKTGGHKGYELPFYGFTIGLLNWIHGVISPDFHPQLKILGQEFFKLHMPAGLHDQLAVIRPGDWERTLTFFELSVSC